MDFTDIPKTLCDTVSLNYSKHQFLIGFVSGSETSAFAVPPELMKAFSAGLQEKIAGYEKDFGTIDTSETKAGIHSPIQM